MDSFARELRLHCARKGSIAQLCKATGINRQQFNKYLAGQILPNARTMRKICVYLGVSEAQLMAVPSGSSVREPLDWKPEIGCEADVASPATYLPAVLRNGFYHAYFPVHGRYPHLLACWLVHIKADPRGGQVYSCRNHFEDAVALGYAACRITYQGKVMYGMEEASLIGTSRTQQPWQGIVYVNLKPEVGEDYFTAMGLTRRPEGPLAMAGALRFLGSECSAREALSGVGVVRLDNPAADRVILNLMRRANSTGPNWMQAVRTVNPRPDSRSEGSLVPEVLALRRLAV